MDDPAARAGKRLAKALDLLGQVKQENLAALAEHDLVDDTLADELDQAIHSAERVHDRLVELEGARDWSEPAPEPTEGGVTIAAPVAIAGGEA